MMQIASLDAGVCVSWCNSPVVVVMSTWAVASRRHPVRGVMRSGMKNGRAEQTQGAGSEIREMSE